MYIFLTENLINGKKYIGKQVHSYDCYLGSGIILKKAIKKYWKDNFKKIILEHVNNEKELNEKEKYWIEKFNAVNDNTFYNLADGGQGGDLSKFVDFTNYKGRKIHTEEWKRELSKRMKGDGNPMKDKTHSKAARAKISKANKGKERNFSKEHRENLSISQRGKKHSLETKKKMSVAKTGSTKSGVKVVQEDMTGNIIKEFKSVKEASRSLNIPYRDCHYILIGSETHLKRHGIILKRIWNYLIT